MTTFFLNDTPTTEIYTLSLHDARTMFLRWKDMRTEVQVVAFVIYQLKWKHVARSNRFWRLRSEEHTELQSQSNLVCRLLLEKKNKHARLTYFSRLHD